METCFHAPSESMLSAHSETMPRVSRAPSRKSRARFNELTSHVITPASERIIRNNHWASGTGIGSHVLHPRDLACATHDASVLVVMNPSPASPAVAGFPMTSLFSDRPALAIWNNAEFGKSPPDVFNRLSHVEYVPSVLTMSAALLSSENFVTHDCRTAEPTAPNIDER